MNEYEEIKIFCHFLSDDKKKIKIEKCFQHSPELLVHVRFLGEGRGGINVNKVKSGE